MEERLIQLPEEIEELGHIWAEKEELAETLDDTKKSLLSSIMNALEGSEASRNRKALVDPRYMNHLVALREAKKEALKARVTYQSKIRLHESIRTVISLEKTKAKIL